MNIKIVPIAFILALLVFASGCGENTENPAGGSTTTKRFIGGTDGLVLEFLDGAPPAETYDGGNNNFGIAVKVENKGESAVTTQQAKLKLTGFLPSDFGVTAQDMEEVLTTDLNGMDVDPQGNTLVGGTDVVSFGDTFDHDGVLSGNTPYSVQASICYQYTTKASATLCVEEDLLDPDSKGAVCEAENSAITPDVSGGPVQLEETMTESVIGQNRISFTFTVKKATEEGELFSPNSGACVEESQYEDTVYVVVNTGMAGELSCTGLSGQNGQGTDSGSVKLFSGSRQIICQQELTDLGDYTKEANIDITYDYRQYASTEILVRHI